MSMSLGLGSSFNILQQSPHDFAPPAAPQPPPEPTFSDWVPSRFNVHASTEDGRLVLWNTFRGSMNVFKAEQKAGVKRLLDQRGIRTSKRGMVKYLVDRGFLVPKGTDEKRRMQLAFGRQHYRTDVLEMFVLSSEDCNFRCEYCYEDFARGTMKPWVREGIKKLVEERAPSLRTLGISWFGGEPLYGFEAIEDLAPFFVDVSERHGMSHWNHMTTNGFLLTPERAEKLLSWKVNNFQITIDGAPEDHDRTRPTREGGSSFWTILENLVALQQRPETYQVQIRVNVSPNNYPHMDRFFDLVEGPFRGDDRFLVRFHSVGRWGGDNDQNLEVCGLDESVRVQAELKREAHRRGLNIGGSLREVQALGSQVCYAGRPYNLIIGATGKVMKCTVALDTEDYNVVGHITPEGKLDLDIDKMALWTEPAFENDKQCGRCVMVPTCQGLHCPLVRIEKAKRPCPPTRLRAKDAMLEMVEVAEQKTARVGEERLSA
jgi:uncharacterized protein